MQINKACRIYLWTLLVTVVIESVIPASAAVDNRRDSLRVGQPSQTAASLLTRQLSGQEEKIFWAGDLRPVTEVIQGQPHAPTITIDLWASYSQEEQLLESLELWMVVENQPEPFLVEKEGQRIIGRNVGSSRQNLRIELPIPEKVQELLAQRGRLRYRFQYRVKGAVETSGTNTQGPEGELVYHPSWLFQHGMATINVKAWHSDQLSGFEAVRRSLPKLKELGAMVIVLQGIHPGHSVFEIDDFAAVDEKLGGDAGLDLLLKEGREQGFRFIMPWVPGHASDQNRWVWENPELFYRVRGDEGFSPGKTIEVSHNDSSWLFLKGNVFHEGSVNSAEVPEGFGPTVAFNLWDAAARSTLTERWKQILGGWVRRGFSGFYTDTAHSIRRVLASENVNDKNWLIEIERSVRNEHPGVIFGQEAFWYDDGGFIQAGSSFAQPKWPYEELLLPLVRGNGTARQVMDILRQRPAEMMQREVVFLQHHDGDVNPVALLVQWSGAAQQDALTGVLGALQMLGMPGIPSVEIGQLVGDRQKWNVTGNTSNYDERYNYGYDPAAPVREPFAPFSDRSARAVQFQNLYANLFRLRANNPAIQWAEGARYPAVSSDNVFVSYRSSGNRGALVVLNLNRANSDPASHEEISIDLSMLGLPNSEIDNIRMALSRPSLVWPALSDAQTTQGSIEGGLLKLKMAPIQAVVLEFEVTAGQEESPTQVPDQYAKQVREWPVWPTESAVAKIFPPGKGPVLTRFSNPGEKIDLYATVQLPVPSDWIGKVVTPLAVAGQPLPQIAPFTAILNSPKGHIDDVQFPLNLRERFRQYLQGALPAVYIRYRVSDNEPEQWVRGVPIDVLRIVSSDSKLTGTAHLEVRFRVDIQVNQDAEFPFFVQVLESSETNPRLSRLAVSGWVRHRVIENSEIFLPEASWMGTFPWGDQFEVARLKDGKQVGRVRAPEHLITEMVEAVQKDSSKIPRADVGVRSGALIGSTDLIDLDESPDLFPLKINGDVDWRRRTELGVWLGYERDHAGRMVFVLQALSDQRNDLIGLADELTAQLKAEGISDYNIRVTRHGDLIRVWIAPRNPAYSSARGLMLADQDYWLVNTGDNYILLNFQQMEQSGLFSRSPEFPRLEVDKEKPIEPFLRAGDPIRGPLEGDTGLTVDGLTWEGVWLFTDKKQFYDDRTLFARMELAFRLAGVPSSIDLVVFRDEAVHQLEQLQQLVRARLEPLTELADRKLLSELNYGLTPLIEQARSVNDPTAATALLTQIAGITAGPGFSLFGETQEVPVRLRAWVSVRQIQLNQMGQVENVRGWIESQAGVSPVEAAQNEIRELFERTTVAIPDVEALFDIIRTIQNWNSMHTVEFSRALSPEDQILFTDRISVEVNRLRILSGGRIVEDLTTPVPVPNAAAGSKAVSVVGLSAATNDVVLELSGEGEAAVLKITRFQGGAATNLQRGLAALDQPVRLFAPPNATASRVALFVTRKGRREIRLVPQTAGGLVYANTVESLLRPVSSEPGLVIFADRLSVPAAGGDSVEQVGHFLDTNQAFVHQNLYLLGHPSWSPELRNRLLQARPLGVFTPLPVLLNWAGENRSADLLRSDLETVAQIADTLRMQHGVREWLVYLETGGLVLVTQEGWWAIRPTALMRLAYVSGAADETLAAYLSGRARGETPLQSALQAVAADTYHLSSLSGQRGTAPSAADLLVVYPPLVEPLVIPKSMLIRRLQSLDDAAVTYTNDYRQQLFQSLIEYLRTAPLAADPDFTAVEAWWDGWAERLPNLTGLLEISSTEQVRQLVELLDRAPRPSPLYQIENRTFHVIERTIAPSRRLIQTADAGLRVYTAFDSIVPDSRFQMTGIGPSESARAANILTAITPMMPEALRSRLFVLTTDQRTADALNDFGILANFNSRDLLGTLNELRQRQGNVDQLQAVYFGTGEERRALAQAAALYSIPIALELRSANGSLALYLQELLHNLTGLSVDTLSGQINFDQLAVDIETLMAA